MSRLLDELNELADKAFEKKTIEGYLASVLIYHQLTEEFIRILIESSTFLYSVERVSSRVSG